MSDDNERQEGATDPDLPRLGPTEDDTDYSLTLEQVGDLFAQAGVPRDLRTLQRYCRKGRLKARLFEFPYGDRYLITPTSVERRIAYLKELQLAAAGRGEPGPAMATDEDVIAGKGDERQGATSTDQPRLAAADEQVVAMLKRENEFLHKQIEVKDEQIKGMAQHLDQSNALTGALHQLLAPLLGSGTADRIRTYVADAEAVGDNDQPTP